MTNKNQKCRITQTQVTKRKEENAILCDNHRRNVADATYANMFCAQS